MIVQSVVLPLDPITAFALFTQKISEWWPPDRRHTQDPDSQIILLPTGRFYERDHDGHEVDLGHVRSWDAPNRILLDFFIATGPDKPTEVEIEFTACERGTRVTITHRPKVLSAELWGQRAPRYARSWQAILVALSQAAA